MTLQSLGRSAGDDWAWRRDPVAADLMALAGSALGVRDPDAAGALPHLWETHLLAAARRRHPAPPEAMHIAVRYMQTHADPRFLNDDEVRAFAAAVGLDETTRAGATARRERAAEILGKSSVAAYTRPSRTKRPDDDSQGHTSVESELMTRVARLLEGAPGTVRNSATYGAPRTPAPPTPPQPQWVDRICGTWRGVTATTNLVKALGRKEGPHETFMVIEKAEPGLAVRWYFHEERDVPAVAASLVGFGSKGLRLTCLYEVDVTYMPIDDGFVHHRGTCLLDLSYDDPTVLSGPYYTDVKTSGILDFHDHAPTAARNLQESLALFAEVPRQNARIAALQAAVEAADGGPVLDSPLLPRIG